MKGTHGGFITDTLSNIGSGLMGAFKKMGLTLLPGQYHDPTMNQKFEKWQAPKGVGMLQIYFKFYRTIITTLILTEGGYTCMSKRCQEGGHMTGDGKKWDLVCQIDPNSYHYCVPFKVDQSLSK